MPPVPEATRLYTTLFITLFVPCFVCRQLQYDDPWAAKLSAINGRCTIYWLDHCTFTVTAGASRPFSGKLTDTIGRLPVMYFGVFACIICGFLYPVMHTVAGFCGYGFSWVFYGIQTDRFFGLCSGYRALESPGWSAWHLRYMFQRRVLCYTTFGKLGCILLWNQYDVLCIFFACIYFSHYFNSAARDPGRK